MIFSRKLTVRYNYPKDIILNMADSLKVSRLPAGRGVDFVYQYCSHFPIAVQ